MSTAFSHADSYVLPFCSLVEVADLAEREFSEPSQDEVDATQAVAVYRRVLNSADDLSDQSMGFVSDKLSTLSIDELRRLAAELQVPDRNQVGEKWELIAEIRRRM